MAETVQCQMDAMSSQGGTNRIRSEGNPEKLDSQDESQRSSQSED